MNINVIIVSIFVLIISIKSLMIMPPVRTVDRNLVPVGSQAMTMGVIVGEKSTLANRHCPHGGLFDDP